MRQTPHGSQGFPRQLGVVSGFLLKLVRESTGLTQARLAAQLGVDTASVQGWESGRRPLAALRAADLVRLRSRLLSHGARPTALSMLEDAIRADLIINEIVQTDQQSIELAEHPLGGTVHQRRLSNLITWPFTGIHPSSLRDLPKVQVRRGPVPNRPTLSREERTRFFDQLLVTAETHRTESARLIRRQAIYLLGFDTRTSTTEWLCAEQLHELRNARSTNDLPSWVGVRSSAVALAKSGDRDPLRAFLQLGLATDQLEQANLNYWAYWVGEIDTIQINDEFMNHTDPRSWTGYRLVRQLLERLHPGSGHTELNLHTLWALLLTHPALLSYDPSLRSTAADKVELLAEDQDLSVQARRELSDISYAIRLADR